MENEYFDKYLSDKVKEFKRIIQKIFKIKYGEEQYEKLFSNTDYILNILEAFRS